MSFRQEINTVPFMVQLGVEERGKHCGLWQSMQMPCSFVIGTELKEAGGLTESREKSLDYLRRKLRKLW